MGVCTAVAGEVATRDPLTESAKPLDEGGFSDGGIATGTAGSTLAGGRAAASACCFRSCVRNRKLDSVGFLFRIERAAKGDCKGFGANERGSRSFVLLPSTVFGAPMSGAAVRDWPGVIGAFIRKRGAVEGIPPSADEKDVNDEFCDLSNMLRAFCGTGV